MISSLSGPRAADAALTAAAGATPPSLAQGRDPEVRNAFDSFVGETLFGQMLKSMRKTVGKPAYFHGGRGEEVFTQQLDQMLAQKLSQSSADQLSGPMFELMTLRRS